MCPSEIQRLHRLLHLHQLFPTLSLSCFTRSSLCNISTWRRVLRPAALFLRFLLAWTFSALCFMVHYSEEFVPLPFFEHWRILFSFAKIAFVFFFLFFSQTSLLCIQLFSSILSSFCIPFCIFFFSQQPLLSAGHDVLPSVQDTTSGSGYCSLKYVLK